MVNVPQAGVENFGSGAPPLFKIYAVIAVTTLIALAASFLFSEGMFFFGALVLLLFLSLFALQVILLTNADHYLTTAIVINGLAWASFFYQAISFYFVIALGFLLLFLFSAARRGKDELKNSLKIKVSRVVRAVVGLSTTAVVIFIFVSMVLATKITLTEERVHELTDAVVTPIAKHYVKDFSPDMKTGELFTKLAERNFAANRVAVNQSVTQLRKDVEGYVGADVDLNKSVSQNLYQALQFKISTLTLQAKIYWILILLGVIFLSVKSIEFLIALPLILFTFLLYQLLLVFNFASVDLKDRSQEVVLLK